MGNIGTLTATINANTTGLDLAARQVGSFVTSTTSSMSSVSKAVMGVGAAFAAIGATAVLTSIIKKGAEFEQTMAVVQGVSQATADQFQALTDISRELGATTEWTATQAAEGLKFLSMAGFEVNESLKVLPGMLDLATAGNIDLGRAADIATNALTAMNLPVSDMNRVGDVFVATITRTNTNMEMMAESFKYAAPSARAFGYSIEELSTLIGLLGNAGIQGSMAGTQLAFAMQKGAEWAEKQGMSNTDLISVLERLNETQATNLEIMDIFGMRGGRAALILKDMIDKYFELNKEINNSQGEMSTLAGIMRDTLKVSFDKLLSAITEVSLSMFDVFAPDMRNNVDGMTESILAFKDTFIILAKIVKMPFQIIGSAIDLTIGALSYLNAAFAGAFLLIVRGAIAVNNALMKVTGLLPQLFNFDVATGSKINEYLTDMADYLENIAVAGQQFSIDKFLSAAGLEPIFNKIGEISDEVLNVRDSFYLTTKGAKELYGWVDKTEKKNKSVKTIMKDVSKMSDDQLKAYAKMYENIDDVNKNYKIQSELIKREGDSLIKMGFDVKEVNKWIDNQTRALDDASISAEDLEYEIYGLYGTYQNVDSIVRDLSRSHEEAFINAISYADDFTYQLMNVYGVYQNLEAEVTNFASIVRYMTDDQLKVYSSMYSSMKNMGMENYEIQKELIRRQGDAYRQLGIDADIVNAWITEQNRLAYIDGLKNSGQFFDGVKAGYLELQASMKTWSEIGYDLMTTFAKSSTSALSDLFFDVMKGEFTSLKDYASSIADAMLRKVADTAAEMAVQWALGFAKAKAPTWLDAGLGLLADIFSFHEGAWNVIFGSEGLKQDEAYAKLKAGEMVVPPDVSENIRQMLGADAGFDSLEAAVAAGTSVSGSIVGKAFSDATNSNFIRSMILASASALSEGVGLGNLFSFAPAAYVGSAIGKGIPAAAMAYTGSTSDQARWASKMGTIVNTLAGGNLLTGAISNFIGGIIGESLADIFNVRTWQGVKGLEWLADKYEKAGTMSAAMLGQFMNAAAGLISSHTLGTTSEDYLAMLGQYADVPAFATPEGAMDLYGWSYKKGTGLAGIPYEQVAKLHPREIVMTENESDVMRVLDKLVDATGTGSNEYNFNISGVITTNDVDAWLSERIVKINKLGVGNKIKYVDKSISGIKL